jgi:hypothetical protein
MKTLRVLFALVVLLGLFVQGAGATPSTVGFVPLLSSVDASLPVELQTRDAMRAVLPALMAAQARGEILEFEPSLSTGVLKILYAGAGAGKSAALAGRPVFGDMREAVSAIPFPQAVASEAIGPEVTPRFSMRLYDNCFKASGLSSNARVTGSLRDKTGRSIALLDIDADVAGNISFGCFSWSGSYSDVAPGFKVTFKEYNGATNALIRTYMVVAPTIRYTAIDKLNSIVRGTAPAGKPYTARWYHRNWNATNTVLNIAKSGTVPNTGAWAVDFGAVKIRGNDHLNMMVVVNTSFDFDRWMDVPHVYCILGGNYCEVSGFAFGAAFIKMVRGTASYTYSGRFGADGYFRTEFQTLGGDPIFLLTGDKVSGTGVVAFPLPFLSSAISATTVSGKAPANAYFDLWVMVMSDGVSYRKYVKADSVGNYFANYSGSIANLTAQPISTQIYYTNLLSGNAVDFFSTFGP